MDNSDFTATSYRKRLYKWPHPEDFDVNLKIARLLSQESCFKPGLIKTSLLQENQSHITDFDSAGTIIAHRASEIISIEFLGQKDGSIPLKFANKCSIWHSARLDAVS